MAQSEIDLDELKKFRNQLERISTDMKRVRSQLSKEVTESVQYWDDEVRPGFVVKHTTLDLVLQRFEKQSADYIEWADKKYAAGKTYLEGRSRF